MTILEKEDIQGLLIRGHGNLSSASYLLYSFTDPAQAGNFLKEILPKITAATEKPEEQALQIAFTYEGMAFLNLPGPVLDSFCREFKEGMTEKQRQFILGDTGENAPHNWSWGENNLHFMLMVFGKDLEKLDRTLSEIKVLTDSCGIVMLHALPTGMLHGQKEHFGFRDDISRPLIWELLHKEPDEQAVTFPAGEFIMGYKNLYEEYAPSPTVPQALDKQDRLPYHPDNESLKDLGKNGTYLVFRQMEQKVHVFWQYMKAQSKDKISAIALASKMVGRWPDGSPLTLCPVQPDPNLSETNDFGFWQADKDGLKCPIGSHIRRTNPRDHLVTEKSQKDSTEMAAKHRMIRKGRPYGPPVTPELNPEDMLDSIADTQERGLHFICLVTDIRRQFEFVQNNWVNFHKFGGLENDADPIIGNHYQSESRKTDEFSIPAYPVRRKLDKLPNFTTIKGGAYFFLPGIRALQYIADHE
ncbi:Dyp-type peroxidase [Cyclobacterium sp. SYSU L10401]|uniref:Dyp-type peroxidase n=1 Tax=Cyclobacterium sp. SYSU L10401 TaxID=2678657 RepID=UPI0013D7004A|nr:peroxidase [Cyclobacterium sp. SYSU L10401]